MPLTDQRHSVRLPLPDLFERGTDTVAYAPVYLDGALVAPSAGTVSVYDTNNVAVVDGAAVTISGDIAQYTVTGATTTGLTLGEGWRIEWALTVGALTVNAVNDAALVRRVLHPAISDVDLYRRVPALDPNGSAPITSLTDYQDALDESWTVLQRRLIDKGHRPSLVISPGALRECHLQLCLGMVYDDLQVRLANPDYADRAKVAYDRYEAAWKGLALVYDEDDDGQVDLGEDGTPARRSQPSIWLMSRR